MADQSAIDNSRRALVVRRVGSTLSVHSLLVTKLGLGIFKFH